ncbi:MAG: hypothetical protein WBA57_26835 [Elainellaceae cyanobacterium]
MALPRRLTKIIRGDRHHFQPQPNAVQCCPYQHCQRHLSDKVILEILPKGAPNFDAHLWRKPLESPVPQAIAV